VLQVESFGIRCGNVKVEDAPYLLASQLFLGKMLVLSKDGSMESSNFASDIALSALVIL